MKNKVFAVMSVLFCVCILFSLTSCGKSYSNLTPASATTRPRYKFDIVADKENVLKIKTNLPINTKSTTRIIGKKYDIDISVDMAVDSNQCFVAQKAITDSNGNSLKDGLYIVVCETKPVSEQPDDVREIMGSKGQNMIGGNVYANEHGYLVHQIVQCEVKGGKFYSYDESATTKA